MFDGLMSPVNDAFLMRVLDGLANFNECRASRSRTASWFWSQHSVILIPPTSSMTKLTWRPGGS